MKNRKVITRDGDLDVNDAKAHGELTIGGNVTVGQDASLQQNLVVCGTFNALQSTNINGLAQNTNVDITGLIGQYNLGAAGNGQPIKVRMRLYDGVTGFPRSDEIWPPAGEATWTRARWFRGRTSGTISSVGVGVEVSQLVNTMFVMTYDNATKSTTYLDVPSSSLPVLRNFWIGADYDIVRDVYVVVGVQASLSAEMSLWCIRPATGVCTKLTPDGSESPATTNKFPHNLIIIGDRAFAGTNFSSTPGLIQEFSRTTGAWVKEIDPTVTFVAPPGGNPINWPAVDTGASWLDFTLDDTRTRLYVLYGASGYRILGHVDAASETALSDLISSGTFTVTTTQTMPVDFLNGISYMV